MLLSLKSQCKTGCQPLKSVSGLFLVCFVTTSVRHSLLWPQVGGLVSRGIHFLVSLYNQRKSWEKILIIWNRGTCRRCYSMFWTTRMLFWFRKIILIIIIYSIYIYIIRLQLHFLSTNIIKTKTPKINVYKKRKCIETIEIKFPHLPYIAITLLWFSPSTVLYIFRVHHFLWILFLIFSILLYDSQRIPEPNCCTHNF